MTNLQLYLVVLNVYVAAYWSSTKNYKLLYIAMITTMTLVLVSQISYFK